MTLLTPTDSRYYIKPRAVSFAENDLGDVNRVYVSIASGTTIMVYVPEDNLIPYDDDKEYQKWVLTGYPTKIATSDAYYIYARLSRSDNRAIILFSTKKYKVDGSVEGEEGGGNASGNYYYIPVGTLTATDGTTPRELSFDSGKLSTPDNSYTKAQADEQFVSFEIADKRFLNALEDDTAHGLINFEKGVRISNILLQADADVLLLTHIETGKTASFAASGAVSAKGVGTSGGGSSEGGANTLYQLWDVLKDSSADKVAGAEDGSVLVYKNGKWQGSQINIPEVNFEEIENALDALDATVNAHTTQINGLQNTVTEQGREIAKRYLKPSTGIPLSDLASGIQTSLGLANTAFQAAVFTKANIKTTLGISDWALAETVPTTDAVAEGKSNLYFTTTRVKDYLTGAISTVLTSALTANRVVVSNTNGKITASGITTTKLGYLTDVTSNIQAQFTNTNTAITGVSNRLTKVEGWFNDDVEGELSTTRNIKTTGSIAIGDATLSWDGTTLIVDKPFASTQSVSAKGIGTNGGGSGSAVDLTNVVSDIIPASSTYKIGSSAKPFGSVYANSIYMNGNLVVTQGDLTTYDNALLDLQNNLDNLQTSIPSTYATIKSLKGYLPLSGGTLTGELTVKTALDTKLVFDNTDGEKYTRISFRENGVEYGNLVCNADSVQYNYNAIFHAGNYTNYTYSKSTIDNKIANGSVNYATSAGNADTLDGLHSTDFDRIYTSSFKVKETGWYRLVNVPMKAYNLDWKDKYVVVNAVNSGGSSCSASFKILYSTHGGWSVNYNNEFICIPLTRTNSKSVGNVRLLSQDGNTNKYIDVHITLPKGTTEITVTIQGNVPSSCLPTEAIKGFSDTSAYNVITRNADPLSSRAIGGLIAEKATLLATPRTLWGKSFDGSGDVSGNLTNVGNITSLSRNGETNPAYRLTYDADAFYLQSGNGVMHLSGHNVNKLSSLTVHASKSVFTGNIHLGTNSRSLYVVDTNAKDLTALVLNSNNDFLLGQGTATEGYNTYLYGNNIYLKYGKNVGIGLTLNESGNVTVGPSDLATTNYKLYVNGNSYINGVLNVKNHIFEEVSDTLHVNKDITINATKASVMQVNTAGVADGIDWAFGVLSQGGSTVNTANSGVGILLSGYAGATQADGVGRGAGIAAVAESTWYNTTGIAFYVNHTDTDAYSEKLRLTNAGNLVPMYSTTQTLGTSDKPWGSVYANTVNAKNVNSPSELQLISTDGSIKLLYNNDSTKSVLLNGSAFKPYDGANGKLSLGTSSGQWHTLYTKYVEATEGITLANNKHLYIKDTNGTAHALLKFDANNNFNVGRDSAVAGYDTYINGKHLVLRGGTALNVGLILNEHSNVTIGGTDIVTTNYKFGVNGKSKFTGTITYSNDASMTIYGVNNVTYGVESVAIQTCFDNQDPVTSEYVSRYEQRCNLLLQPRGGQVYIGYNPSELQLKYSLSVGGGDGYFQNNLEVLGSTKTKDLYIDGVKLWVQDGVLYTDAPFASLKSVSAKGTGTSGGTGGGVDVDWNNFPSSIIPSNNTYDLGSNAKPWDRLFATYVGGASNYLYFDGSGILVQGRLSFASGMDYIDTEGNGHFYNLYVDGNEVATKDWVESNYVLNSALDDYVTKSGIVETVISGTDKAYYYRISLYNSVANAYTYADIPSYALKGFESIESVGGVFLADDEMVYDILDYVDAKVAWAVSNVDLSNYYTKAQVHSYVAQEINTFNENLATVATSGKYSDLTGKPTTLAGYGITDALPKSNPSVAGTLTVAGNVLPSNNNDTYALGSTNYRWSKLYVNGVDCTGSISSTTNISAQGNVTAINGGLSGKTLSVSGAASVGSLTVNGVAITGNGGGSFNGGTVSGETIFGSVGSNYMDTYQVYIGGVYGGGLGVEGLIDAWGGVAGNGWEIMDTGDAYFQSVDQASDATLKSIIKDVRLSLGTMANAPLVQFDWKNKPNSKHHIGTIAQYWDSCLPEVVSRTKGGTLALGYGELGVAMGISLAKEMIEMLTRVDNTESEIDKLKKRISELEKEIENLKA